MAKSSSREHICPEDRAVKGTGAEVLSLNPSHAEAGTQAPWGRTQLPVPPHPCTALGGAVLCVTLTPQ